LDEIFGGSLPTTKHSGGKYLQFKYTYFSISVYNSKLFYVKLINTIQTGVFKGKCENGIFSLRFNGHLIRWIWVSQYQNVSILDFIGAKDDGSSGGNKSYKTCKAPAKSKPSTNKHQVFGFKFLPSTCTHALNRVCHWSMDVLITCH